MIINAIRLFNFGVYRGLHEVNSVPARGSNGSLPITLIGGMNGSGKTSLRSAILLTLYGKRSPEIGSKRDYLGELARLQSRSAPRDQGTWIELELGVKIGAENQVLRLRRTWRSVNQGITEHLSVWRNGTQDSFLSNTWDQYVDELLPLGLATLFFFDGERIATIAESEETPEIVQEAIRALLGLNVVERAIADLVIVIRRNKSRLRTGATGARFTDIERQKEDLQAQIDQANQSIASISTRILFLENQISSVEDQLIRESGPSSDGHRESEADLRTIEQDTQAAKAELLELCAGGLPFLLIQQRLNTLLKSARRQEEARQAKIVLAALVKRNHELHDWLQTRVGMSVSQDLLGFLEAQEEQLRAAAAQSELLPITSGGVSQLEGLMDAGLEEAESRARAALEEGQHLEERRKLVLWSLARESGLEAARTHLERLKDLSEQRGSYEQQREQLKHRLGSLHSMMKQLEKRELALAEELVQSDEAERTISSALRSQDALREYRKRLAISKSSTLVAYISEAFDRLTHKQTLVAEIRLDPDLLSLTLLDSEGRQFQKSSLSSGERQMLAVSILWGLARASGKELPVVIDSPMGRLDSSHRMNFVREYLPHASQQTIILSTDTEVVGPYLDCLWPFISHTYLLTYDETIGQTQISPAYFASKEAVS